MTATLADPSKNSNPAIRRWLIICAVLVFCMVIVGGATRLTNSGLSITEWKPLLGAIPPFTPEEWQQAFEKYQAIPQYKVQNLGMSLAEFKFIFWWEWAHRLLGRLIGVVFAVPLLYFALRGRITRKLWPRLLILLGLGAAQGGLGWYMVASGLVDRVDVSQYRLAAHLTLAATIYAGLLWVAWGAGAARRRPNRVDAWFAIGLVALTLVQIGAGGFVAGLDAGQGYNTWPKMDGAWLPSGLFSASPAWRNIFENALTVQFDHRMLAYLLLVAAAYHAWRRFNLAAMMLVYIIIMQICLGILTLLMHVPLPVALVHQAGSMIVLASALWNLHRNLVIRSPDRDLQ
jgi:cytochrome c oxidase assembly protein subunit 15